MSKGNNVRAVACSNIPFLANNPLNHAQKKKVQEEVANLLRSLDKNPYILTKQLNELTNALLSKEYNPFSAVLAMLIEPTVLGIENPENKISIDTVRYNILHCIDRYVQKKSKQADLDLQEIYWNFQKLINYFYNFSIDGKLELPSNQRSALEIIRNIKSIEVLLGFYPQQNHFLDKISLSKVVIMMTEGARTKLADKSSSIDFEKFKSLEEGQILGMIRGLEYDIVTGFNIEILPFLPVGLTHEQIKNLSQKSAGLKAIKLLNEKYNIPSYEAYHFVKNFKKSQCKGLTQFGLTLEDVRNKNFGSHILRGIECLTEKLNISHAESFAILKNLTKEEIEGIKAEVMNNSAKDFILTAHLFKYIILEIQLMNPFSLKNVLDKYKDLNEVQCGGVFLGLNMNQVQHINFGKHIIYAVKILITNSTMTIDSAFERVIKYTSEELYANASKLEDVDLDKCGEDKIDQILGSFGLDASDNLTIEGDCNIDAFQNDNSETEPLLANYSGY